MFVLLRLALFNLLCIQLNAAAAICTNAPFKILDIPWMKDSTSCGSDPWELPLSDPDGDTIITSIISTDPEVTGGFSITADYDIACSATEIQTEGITNYVLNISITDGCEENLSYITQTVEFTDIIESTNSYDPEISPLSTDIVRDLYETVGESVVFLNFTVTDADAGPEGKVDTALITGTVPANAPFNIETFALTLTGSLQGYDSSIQLTVEAEDQGTPPRSGAITFTVNIKDRPTFTYPSAGETLYFCEDFAGGDVIANVTNTNPNAGTISYSVVEQVPDSAPFHFEANAASGELRIAGGVAEGFFDVDAADATTQYNVTLRISDGSYDSEISVTIEIDDVNDQEPVIQTISDTNIPDSQPAGSTIFVITTTDGDREAPNNEVSLSLSGTNSGHFIIDGNALKVATPSQLDYSSGITEYNLTVNATDGADPPDELSSSADFTIKVDTAPEFSNETYETSMPEDKEAGDVVFEFTASDRDGQAKGTSLTYNITSTTNLFVVDGAVIKVASDVTETDFDVDVETKSFTLDLSVSDGTYSDTAVMTINVDDVNDNRPAFDAASYSHSMNENTPAGTNILNVTATDSDRTDPNNRITYAMNGDNAAHFEIDETSGAINVASPALLNYTLVQEYSLNITATDGGDTPLSASVIATIAIESSPVLVRPAVNEDPTQINEDKEPDDLVYTFVTTDKDTPSAGLSYSLQDPSPSLPFEIVNNTLKTKSDLGASDLDVDKSTAVRTYTVPITVTDGKYTDTGNVVIEVLDTNDETPAFTEPSYTVEIGEDAIGAITTVTAEDNDYTSPNNEVVYSITDDKGIFEINKDDGEISLVKPPKELSYTIAVEAKDGGSPSNVATTDVVVKVDQYVNNECLESPCANGAACISSVNFYWCDCATGWDGRQCMINIDECAPDPCQNGGSCQDAVADYTCDCEPGWGGKNCTSACTGSTHGRNCAETCSCVDSNIAADALSQRCNIATGACYCNTHWTGSTCAEDAKECLRGTVLCTVANNACEDTEGSYVCVCETGYRSPTNNNNGCIPDTTDNNPLTLPSSVITDALAAGFATAIVGITQDVDNCELLQLHVPSSYNELKTSLETQLKAHSIGSDLRVYNISCGSLDYNVFVEIDNTTEAAINLSTKLKDLRDNGTLTVLNKAAPVVDLAVNGNDVPVENRLCVIYEALSPCGSDYACRVEDGTPYCREVKDDNTDVILGVGIGVGVAGLFLLTVAIAAIIWIKRKGKGSKHSDFKRSRRRHGNRYGDRFDDRYSDRHGERYEERPTQSSYTNYVSREYDNPPRDFQVAYRYSGKYY